MAFYDYNGDAGECHLTPYFSALYDYNAFPIQSSISYSYYGYSNSEQIEQSTNYNYYYTTQMHPQLSYSVHNSTEPKLIHYEKAANSLETRYIISDSTKEHDDTLFEEYDPTPYGGGYDMAQTYGKSLSPSNKICYPRSVPKSNGLKGFESFDYGSIPSPYVSHNNQPEEPQDQSKEMDVKDERMSLSGVKEKPILEDDILEKPIVPLQQDKDFVAGNGTIGEYGYDYGRQLQQIPYGSGLESMDLCESLFGYWPCLAKQNQRRNLNYINSSEDSSNEQWQSTADYLFGNPFGYGGNERYGNSAYSNQNYYNQQQPYFMSDC
ncbi:uncharacterized protein [Nicotiana sylvestris]|uniref:Uncharacterized protein LOC104224008 n=1 Tax=Nicotiana sylvestris TaxID=4096 RepID=A0A1U7W9H6_NICSY|nr:PREDICTED: uncharacterized protein LOC104224008 [Nicotiana sylvestris]